MELRTNPDLQPHGADLPVSCFQSPNQNGSISCHLNASFFIGWKIWGTGGLDLLCFFSSCFLLGRWVCCLSPLASPGISSGPGTSVVLGCWSLATNHWDTRADEIAAQSGAWEEAFFMFLSLPNTSQQQRCVTYGQLSCFFHGWKPGREAGGPLIKLVWGWWLGWANSLHTPDTKLKCVTQPSA